MKLLIEEQKRMQKLAGIIKESAEEEAWELVGQDHPVILSLVKEKGYTNDAESVKKLVPLINDLPEKEFSYNDISQFNNLENKSNDIGLTKKMKEISQSENPRDEYKKAMEERDGGERRSRGYDPALNFDRIINGEYESPVVLEKGGKYYVVGGRTRFYASVAANKPIKTKILKPEDI